MKAIDVDFKVNGQKIKTVEEVLESSDFKTVNGENIVGSGDIEINADVEAIYATETEKDGAYVPDLTDAQISQIYTAYVNKKHIRVMTFSDTRRFYDVLNASDMSCCLLAQMGYIVDYFDFAGEVYIEVHQAGGGSGSVEIDNESITKNSQNKLQAVALKSKGKKVTTDGIVDGNFDGITHFESDEDFVTFVEQGYIEKGGVRLDYDPNGFYSTPSNEHLVGTSSENLVIDIGSSQLTLETDNKVYPKMTVANAKLIYDNYKSGRPFTIKWTLMGVSLYFTPVNATTMTNSFVVVLHDKFIKYEWTNSQADSEELSPQYEAEQTWIHTINCNATTAQGQYKYQFQFRDTDASKYNMLYEVAVHLMQEYEGIRIGASGTYTEGANVYLITSVEASSSSQIAVTMTKLSDGSERIITTGAVAISDSVHK